MLRVLLQDTEMFLVCATDELQHLFLFDSGDAYSDVLKSFKKTAVFGKETDWAQE